MGRSLRGGWGCCFGCRGSFRGRRGGALGGSGFRGCTFRGGSFHHINVYLGVKIQVHAAYQHGCRTGGHSGHVALLVHRGHAGVSRSNMYHRIGHGLSKLCPVLRRNICKAAGKPQLPGQRTLLANGKLHLMRQGKIFRTAPAQQAKCCRQRGQNPNPELFHTGSHSFLRQGCTHLKMRLILPKTFYRNKPCLPLDSYNFFAASLNPVCRGRCLHRPADGLCRIYQPEIQQTILGALRAPTFTFPFRSILIIIRGRCEIFNILCCPPFEIFRFSRLACCGILLAV